MIENTNFEIHLLIEEIIRTHKIIAKGKWLKLSYSIDDRIPQVLNGDPYRIKQVINNLVGNAIKFTDFGEVNLSLNLIHNSGRYVEIEFRVSDTGIGIAPDEFKNLFTAFSQADSSHTRKYGGTGLGLAISKQLVKKMGGSIWVESIKGKGSNFHFTLRLGIGHSVDEKPVSPPAIKNTLQPLKILLVEDDKVNQMVISQMIKEIGHEVVIAHNGVHALQILGDNQINIVLMDIQMPVMDGIETTRKIRKLEAIKGGHIPIIAVTAYALNGDREKFLSAGMDDYISKPIQISVLNELLERNAQKQIVTDDVKQGDETLEAKTTLYYSKRVGEVLERINKYINQLEMCIEKKDISGIEKCAHRIRKLSQEGGTNEIKRAIFKVELAARKEDITDIIKNFGLVKKELTNITKLSCPPPL